MTVKVNGKKVGLEQLDEALDGKNIKNLTMTFGPDLNAEDNGDPPPDDITTHLVKTAVNCNAGLGRIKLENCSKLYGWTVEYLVYSPDYFTGWRKYVKRLSDWLLK